MDSDFLEDIAVLMAEFYARKTKTNYSEDLKSKLYKLLKEEA